MCDAKDKPFFAPPLLRHGSMQPESLNLGLLRALINAVKRQGGFCRAPPHMTDSTAGHNQNRLVWHRTR